MQSQLSAKSGLDKIAIPPHSDGMAGRDVTRQVLEMGAAANLRAEGRTVPEIAEQMGLPVRTVERRLALARQFVTITQTSTAPDGAGIAGPDGSAAGCVSASDASSRHPEQETQR